ncbi:MAG: glycosyltransferase family 4 protein [Candidatus Heimdallarchaeaceae archaeon]
MSLNICMIFELGPDDEGRIGGGVELHATNLSKMLVKMGHKVTYLTGAIPNCKNEKIIEGVKFKRVDFNSLIKKSFQSQELSFRRQLFFLLKSRSHETKKFMKENNFDIFHGHVYSSGLVALYLGKKNKSPVINTIHGSYYKHWDKIKKNPLLVRFYRNMERRLAPYLVKKSAFQIHTDYDFAKLVKKWAKPENRSKIVTILNGVDLDKFNPNVKPNEEILEKEGPVIMTTRRLVAKNGVLYLVRGFPKIVQKHKNARLIIVGDGPEKTKIIQEIKKQKIEDKVLLVGMIPNDQIPAYLAASDIVVVPSIVEASSISVLEAMAMKKPVVASDIPGIWEITREGECCTLVPSMVPEEISKGILQLLKNKKVAEKLAENGYKEVVEKYSWQKKAKDIETIYIKALEKN